MKKRTGFVCLRHLAWLFAFVLTFAGAGSAFGEPKAPSRIVYSGDYAYPPFSMLDSNGEPTGFTIELIKAVGNEVGIAVEIRLMPWKKVREEFETKRTVDVATMFYSAKRDEFVDYAVPLVTVVHELFVRRGSPPIESLNALRGKRLLVEENTYPAEYIAAQHPEIQLIPAHSEPECLDRLSKGEADAALVNQAVGLYHIHQSEIKNLQSAELPLLPINFSFVTLKGRTALLSEINRGITRVKRTGEYAELYQRWFGTDAPGIDRGISWRTAALAGAAIFVLSAVILGLIWALRRQIADKTRRLRSELEERERIERRLRENEAKLQGILDHSTAVIFVKDLEGRYTLANRVFHEVTGKTDVVGHTDSELFSPAQARKFTENDQHVLAGDVPMKFEEYTEHGDERRTFVTVKFPIRDSDGVIRSLGGISMDISERKRFEQEIQGARTAAERASKAKDHFLAVLSHELRTPLTPVLAAVAEALSTQVSEEQREMLEMIQRNIEFESRLIEDLLDLTRLARGKLGLNFQTADAHDLLREAAAICAPGLAAKDQELCYELNAEHPFVNGDPSRLQQVFWNLIQNAIKFSPPRTKIVLRSCNPDFGQLSIQCIDAGVGMEKHVLEQIFRPFEQVETAISRRHGGLGLGLSIAHMIIEAHHGKITADSAGAGQGSAFTILLPTVAAPQPSAAPPPRNIPERTERLRILLVEDSHDTRRVLAKLLKAKGHHVETAENVADARALWHHDHFDVLLSDIGLPDASGLDLAQELRKDGPLRAIAFSGFGSAEDIQKSKDAGFAEHLVKPLDINALKETLGRVMEQAPAPATPDADAPAEVPQGAGASERS